MLSDLRIRLRGLVRRRRVEQELDDELRFHIEQQAAAYLQAGLSPDEARRRARADFGGLDQIKEDCRDARGTRWIEDAAQDARFAARLLVRDRWFTVAAVTALALGIASSTTVFTIVNAMVLRGLPVEHPDRIVTFFNRAGGTVLNVSFRDLEDWRAAAVTLDGLAGYSGNAMIVGDEGRSPESSFGSYISTNAFHLVGVRPILGRDFLASDDVSGAPTVVMLGHALWVNRYGSDPGIVGRTIRVNNLPATVIGVMPEGFRFPLIDELWQPLGAMPQLDRARRDRRVLRAFGRLAEGIRIREARAELNTVAARLAADHPDTNDDIRPAVEPFTGSARHAMYQSLFGAVAFVVLIACANVANLLLARGARRSRELSVRRALGATRGRLVRQLLLESLLVASMAGGAGLGLAAAGVRLFSHAVSGIPFAYWYHERWTMDGSVFGFLAAVSLGTVFLFGLLPALNVSKSDVCGQLKDDSRTVSGSLRTRRWVSALIVLELAFTLTLLAGAGLMMRSFMAVYLADRVIDASAVLTSSLRLPDDKYSTAQRQVAFYQRLEERLRAIPPLASSAVASTAPFIGAPIWQVTIEGRREPRPGAVSFVTIGPRYFEVLGLPLLRGRTFTALDGVAGRENVIVSQRFVDVFLPGADPIGSRIRLSDPREPGAAPLQATIVGVSPTLRQQFMAEIGPVVYVPYRASPTASARLMVRTRSDPAAITSLVREELRALDPDLPLNSLVPLDVMMAQSRWGHRVFGTMFLVFAGVALLLAAIGLYALTAYAVSQRTQEIGVRMALGAQTRQVVWLFVGRTIWQLAGGLALGLAGAYGIGRLVRSMLVSTSPTDPLTMISIAVLLAVVALAACWLPARRATRLDPVIALRYE